MPQMKGLYTIFSSWHIDPCRFPRCGGYNCWATSTPAQLRSVSGMLKLNPTCYRIECHSKERSVCMVITHLIGHFSWSPTITTIN